jgi:hypothetical protein
MLELEVVLELKLDREHVAAPPSCHHPGTTHRDAPLWPCLPAAPGRRGLCCVRAGMPCLPKHRLRLDRAAAASKLEAVPETLSFGRPAVESRRSGGGEGQLRRGGERGRQLGAGEGDGSGARGS